jgi:hypothetical protein
VVKSVSKSERSNGNQKNQRYDLVPTIYIRESSGRRWKIVGCGVDSCRKSEATSFRAGGNLRALGGTGRANPFDSDRSGRRSGMHGAARPRGPGRAGGACALETLAAPGREACEHGKRWPRRCCLRSMTSTRAPKMTMSLFFPETRAAAASVQQLSKRHHHLRAQHARRACRPRAKTATSLVERTPKAPSPVA